MFLNCRGVVAALPQSPRASRFSKSFTPYIFTKKQIECILRSADTMPKTQGFFNINAVLPIILRLLYCCGLRISEATALRIRHINLDQRTITILHSKNDDCRIVPMSESLKDIITAYLEKIHAAPKDDDFVFPTHKGERYSSRTIYDRFREILWRSNISHGGRGLGPRLHDIRHTFAAKADS